MGASKNKIKDNIYFIQNLKAHPFAEETRLMKLITWKV
ncbi:hypothetical protein QO000_000037 [Alkalihalobacillus hemicentroti]|uniref:Uncharacterized protein n=1 Tax=Guptibacillus hwajinpoensis TaxID=208199 RepID=A0ABU0JVF6_9BACL|nr:hypothetical protein [Alkalihalobacillus hemicentroti]